MVKDKGPTLLFLIETKVKQKRLQGMRWKMGFEGVFVVDPVGRSGGLALFWKDSKEIEILNYLLRHIHAKVTLAGSNWSWKLTCFYGHPNRLYREESWNLLSHLSTGGLPEWLCIGDFNEISNWSEKVGGVLRNEAQMASFNSTLEGCRLQDMGFKGPKFTWRNGREPTSFIKERLDRALATEGWLTEFPIAVVEVLPNRTSDHNPLWIRFKPNFQPIRRPRLFRFEAY
jgi:polyhydroxyalkanoate synthesis regulator phasin